MDGTAMSQKMLRELYYPYLYTLLEPTNLVRWLNNPSNYGIHEADDTPSTVYA